MIEFRAYLQVHVEADSITEAYNRIEILMMHWPKRRWCYPKPDDWIGLDTAEPHLAPDNDNPKANNPFTTNTP